MACEIFIQKSNLINVLKQIHPAVDSNDGGGGSMIGMHIVGNGNTLFKAGIDTCRVKSSCRYTCAGEMTEEKPFAIDYVQLANAIRTMPGSEDHKIKIGIRDMRMEFWLPGNLGCHTIPLQEDEIPPIDTLQAEELFTDKISMDKTLLTFKKALVVWDLIPNNEKDVSQMVVLDKKLMTCSPGLYFIGLESMLPEGLRISPEVADKTRRFLQQWSRVFKDCEAQFRIIKTEKWNQTWGVIDAASGEGNNSARWLFQVVIPDEESDEFSATLARMQNDKNGKSSEECISFVVKDTMALAKQITAAVAVTEDHRVICEPKTVKDRGVMMLSSKNIMSAKSKIGFPIDSYKAKDGTEFPSIEWNVEVVREILMMFGRDKITITFDPLTMRTYFNNSEGIEVFMSHIDKEAAIKKQASNWKRGASTKDAVEKKEKKKVVVGGDEEGFSELMGEILQDDE